MSESQPEYKKCKFCGANIRPGRNRRREFCNSRCKQAAYNARKRANSQGVAVTVGIDGNNSQPQAVA